MRKLIIGLLVIFSLLTGCSQSEVEEDTTEPSQDYTEFIEELEEFRSNEEELVQKEKEMDMYEIQVRDMEGRLRTIENNIALTGDMVDSYFYGDDSENQFEQDLSVTDFTLVAITDEYVHDGITYLAYYYDIDNEDNDGYIPRYHLTRDMDAAMYDKDQSEEDEESWSFKERDELFNQLSKENYLELLREGLY